jgi:hypothetical protein
MNIGSREKHVNARTNGRLQGLGGAFNVVPGGACKGGNHWARHGRGHGLHRGEIAVRRKREPGLDHVHSEAVQLPGQASLLLHVHAAARGLLPVT